MCNAFIELRRDELESGKVVVDIAAVSDRLRYSERSLEERAWSRLLSETPVADHAYLLARREHAEPEENGHSLEWQVDVHAFSPGDLRRLCRTADLVDVRVRGEELLASIHGWTVRTLEASAEPAQVPWRWRNFAFRSYLALQRVDNQVLEPRLPPQLFYNLLVAARKPERA